MAVLALAGTLQAAQIDWKQAGTSTAWANTGNWQGGVAPANSLTVDVARFDQTSYAFLPNAGTTSVNGLQFGDGTTAAAACVLSGTNLSIGSGGVTLAAGAGAATISSNVTLGAGQVWTNNSTNLLTGPATVTLGGNTLTIAGPGNVTLNALSGTAGITASGAGTLTLNNVLSTAGQLLKITSGTVALNSARNTQANLEVDGGILNFSGTDRYSTSGRQQTFVLTGGQVNYANVSGYGLRLNGDNGTSSAGATGNTFTGNQTGGILSVSGGGAGSFNMGSTSAGNVTNYNLSGTGLLIVTGGSVWSVGADTAGTSTASFNQSGGKLFVSGTMSGSQGTGAKQSFVWTGGTLAAGTYVATNLTSASGAAVSSATGTLTNAGGTLAPGDVGTPGKMAVTGNYCVTSPNAVLSIDIGGTAQASAFQDSAAKYDNLTVSGTVALNGTLAVYLTNGYGPPAASTFTILTSTASGTAISGAFQNVSFGGRMTTADGLGSFVVNLTGNSVVLSNFVSLSKAPQIFSQPPSLTVIAGKTATFSVGVFGNQPITYQWYNGSTAIAGATQPSLAITNATAANAGSYHAVVTNPFGSVTSNTVTLTINPGSTGIGGMIYDLDQTPVTGTNAITDTLGATAGTLVGTPLPGLIAGARSYTGAAWNFGAGSANVFATADAFTNRLGDINQTTGLTVGMWVNLAYSINSGLDNSRALGIGNGNDNICDVTTSNGSGAFQFTFNQAIIVSSGAVLDGSWHHVVATLDYQKSTNNVSLYVDGKNVSNLTSAVANSFSTTATSVTIGNYNNGGSGAFRGSLDQIIVYDRALTAGEIASFYSVGILANQAPLVVVGATTNVVQWPANADTVYATVTDDGLPASPGTVTGSWSKVSTPTGASVTFGSAASASSSLTFSAPGTYVVRYTASDGQLSNFGDVTINVVSNQAPVINACSVTPTVLPSSAGAGTVSLNASATDDGLPNPPGILSTQWSQVSGPATVTVAYPGALGTTASVPATTGTYVLQFSATDGASTTTKNVTVTVADNLPPTVAAGADNQAVTWPGNSTTLRATVSDDGRPTSPGVTTVAWQQVSGPATATLGAANAANCPVTFPQQGQYVFQASAYDGALTTTATTYVNVWSPGKPIVIPGSVRSLWLPNASCTLTGTLQAVSSQNVPVSWTVVQGPGTVTFGTPTALTTTALFSAAGEYWLQLKATDGIYTNSSRLVVEVYDPAVAPGQYGGGNFGYIGANASLLSQFTGDLQLPYDFTGLDWSRLKPPPPPYVHPRVLLNPEDLPDLRNRLMNTSATNTLGPVIWNTINTTTASLLTNQGTSFNQVYNDLGNNITTSFAALGSSQGWFVELLGYEAFRCMVANDTVGGAKAGAALAGVASYVYPIVLANNSYDWQNVNFPSIYSEWMGYSYDFAYNFMTPDQQSIVRQTLARATYNAQGLGLNAIPAFHANSSNWNQWNGFYLVIDGLAVEGETGSDPNLLPRIQGNFERMWSLDIFPEGSLFEGMGKGALFAESLIALGKRGIMIAAVTGAKNHVRQFYSACMETTGYGFTWDEWDAGNGMFGNNDAAKHADVSVIKYLFPADPVVDFIHRNQFGSANYLTSSYLSTIDDNPGNAHNLLGRAICTLDFNTTLTWDQAVAQQVTPNLPLTQFFNNHGLVTARSDWTSNGLRLMFQPRSEPGGHAERDRDVFMLSALGRIWVPYGGPEPESYDYSIDSSVPRIDNVGPTILPAKVMDLFDSPAFTSAAGDASTAYGWSETSSPAALENWNYNQMLLHPDPQPWANLPWGVLPHWWYSTYSPLYWVPNTPVQRAFRTAALVRGVNPYVVLVDDLQKDANPHGYTDRIVLANDLTSVTTNGNDAIVTSSAGGSVSMLVRVLRCAGTPTFSYGLNPDKYNVLDVNTTTVAPNYVVLLLPYTNGAALPTTTWVGNVVNVQWAGGQVDHLAFTPNADGRTRVSFARPTTDTTPPVITVPANIVTTATAAQGNVVGFTATALDDTGGALPVLCVPPSGSVFPIGTTTVQCSATDASLNSAAAAFTVTVQPGAFTLGAPTGLAVSPANLSAKLTWNAVAPAAGYNVYRSFGSASGFTLVGSGVVGTNWVDTGLTNGTTYYYEVSAVNGTGEGPLSGAVSGAPVTVPAPWVSQDLGTVGLAGSSNVAATGAFSIGGAGTGISGNSDSFRFTSEPCSGDFAVVAHLLTFQGASNNSNAGLMLRQSLTTNSANAFVGVNYYSVQFYSSARTTAGGATTSSTTTHSALPQWLKLVKSGTTVTAYDSGDSPPGLQAWVQVSANTVSLSGTMYAGLALDSGSTSALATAGFDHFGIYTPPTVTVPANLRLEATGSAGAAATFAAVGSSNVDGALAAVCTPASGSTFPLGATTVTSVATDNAGQVASGTFTVTVVDTTPPAISVPADISTNATTATGATVTFATSAIDLVSGSVATTSVPASGSVFPIGTTTVTTTATDAAGNRASKTFNVTVTVPAIGAQESRAPSVAFANGNIQVTVGQSVPGRTYQLQRTGDLRIGAWQNVGAPVVGTGSSLVLSDPYVAGVEQQFYRLSLGQ